MVSILRSILPVRSSKEDDDDEYNAEYSFAVEYTGPPVTFDIPKAVPVDVGCIPTASVVSTPCTSGNLSLPVIYPVVKRGSKSFLPEIKESCIGPASIGDDEHVPSSKDGEGSSISLGFSDSQEDSQEFSVSSDGDSLDKGCPEIEELGSASDKYRTHDLDKGFHEIEDLGSASNKYRTHDLDKGCHEIEELGSASDKYRTHDLDKGCHEIEELGSSSEEDRTQETSGFDNRTQTVTFHEPESSVMVQEESDYTDPELLIQERPHARPQVKKGLCYHCLKGNRFTMKEFCIVCDAKYCSKCVLRVMGSMPEGRKCITCIGFPIDESKRKHLGKCSMVLKQLLTDAQVEQVMESEQSCQVNQLSHRLVIVNGKPLSLEEVVQLQTCAYPPKGLRPGSYWYDKLAGFWGKEGHKPSQIISPGLAVGGNLMENASNGNTTVKINNRVITKTELLMLKFARINCKGSPHFWVSHNGSYQEEGQKQMMGKIWEKPGIKTICVLLSLPTPSKSIISSEEEIVNNGSKYGQGNNTDTKSTPKILLVGHDQSGTSAIYKQAKILYNVPFSEDERQKVKTLIQCNLYLYISILLEGLKQFEEEYSIQMRRELIDKPGTSGSLVENIETNIYSLSRKMKSFSDWLLQVVNSGNLELVFPAATREYSPLVEELWKDKAFQATYSRRNELHALPIVADYFLSRAGEISSTVYEPSDMDILYADGITFSNGLSSMEFEVPSSLPDSSIEATEQNDPPLQRYQLIRVNARNLGENCKWLSMFEDVNLILYCVDLTSYDEFHIDNNLNLKNKMIESKTVFENIVTHPSYKDKAFLLILNKFDLFEKKIKTTPLTQCDWFHDFNPFITNHTNSCESSRNNNNASLGQYGFQYIAAKFKRLFSDLTERKLYVSPVTGLERNSVDAALRYGKEVLRWVAEENKPNPSNNEWSSESLETTT